MPPDWKEGTEGGHSLCKGPALRSREQVGEGGRAVQEVQSEASGPTGSHRL